MHIDSHQHFWKFDPVRDSWIDDSMKVIQQDFLPEQLESILKTNGFGGCISVQSDQTLNETDFHLALAEQHEFIRGVVGWVDLQADNIGQQLSKYKGNAKLKGFRHILQGEKQRDFMLRPEFKRGIAALAEFGFTYDILIYPDQLEYSKELIKSFPDQPFVIDHLAKPYIREGKIDHWKKDITSVAQYDNVYCKISGMVTEADWVRWNKMELEPYIDVIVEGFGINQLMFGSDWPVCLVAAKYEQVVDVVRQHFSTYSKPEQDAIFGGTATRFYNL